MNKYQKALEFLQRNDYVKNSVTDICIEVLEKQLNNGWIPVSERLPAKPSQRVLATLENEMVLEVWYINNKFKFLDKMNFEEVSDYNPVIAWQPLPEPYKEET